MQSIKKGADLIVYLFFFLSGFSALLFEVVWEKKAFGVFGNSAYSVCLIVAAFMSGLALGARFLGSRFDAYAPKGLLIYAFLELGIGIYALLFDGALAMAQHAYGGIYKGVYLTPWLFTLYRYLMSFAVLLIPTFFMGATLPALVSWLKRRHPHMRASSASLYSFNLLGAAFGAILAGYALIPSLGLIGTSRVGVAMNVCIFLISLYIHTLTAGQTVVNSALPDHGAVKSGGSNAQALLDKPLFIGLIFVQGFVAFVLQMAWVRQMNLIHGSSTYTFSCVLFVCLLGLWLGNLIVLKIASIIRNHPEVALSSCLMLSALLALLELMAVERVMYLRVLWDDWVVANFLNTLGFQILGTAMLLILPAISIGCIFPLALVLVESISSQARNVSRVYTVNTIGAVAGSILSTFWLIPIMGIFNTLKLCAVVLTLMAICSFFLISGRKAALSRLSKSFAVFFLIGTLVLMTGFDRMVYASGVFMYARLYATVEPLSYSQFIANTKQDKDLLFYKDGPSATVGVTQSLSIPLGAQEKSRALFINAKTEASSSADMSTQIYCAYLPIIASSDPKNVLVIGLGSGVSAATAAAFEDVERVDVVEIEPEVVKASKFFTPWHLSSLTQQKVHMIIGDGRNHLRFSAGQYDVIVSEPSNPWISGVSTLFTLEHFQAARQKLTEQGVYCQWLHAYQMSLDDFQMIIRTFSRAFPGACLYRVNDADYLLLASKNGEPVFSLDRIVQIKKKYPRLQRSLKKSFSEEEFFALDGFLLSSADLSKLVQTTTSQTLNTDDRLRLEYNAPKYLYQSWLGQIKAWLHSVDRQYVYPKIDTQTGQAFMDSSYGWLVYRAEGDYSCARQDYARGISAYARAKALKADSLGLSLRLGRALEKSGQVEAALKAYRHALNEDAANIQAQGSYKHAIVMAHLKKSSKEFEAQDWSVLAALSYVAGDTLGASEEILKAIDLAPTNKSYRIEAMYYSHDAATPQSLASAWQLASSLEQELPHEQKVQWTQEQLIEKLDKAKKYLAVQGFQDVIEELEPAAYQLSENYLFCELLRQAYEATGNSLMSRKYTQKIQQIEERYQ